MASCVRPSIFCARLGSNSRKGCEPRCASPSAMLALRSHSGSAPGSSSPLTAPAQARSTMSSLPTENGWSKISSRWRHLSCICCGVQSCSHSMANSLLAVRASRAGNCRWWLRSRSATARSSCSPVPWPTSSRTLRKFCSSSRHSAAGQGVLAAAAASACSIRPARVSSCVRLSYCSRVRMCSKDSCSRCAMLWKAETRDDVSTRDVSGSAPTALQSPLARRLAASAVTARGRSARRRHHTPSPSPSKARPKARNSAWRLSARMLLTRSDSGCSTRIRQSMPRASWKAVTWPW